MFEFDPAQATSPGTEAESSSRVSRTPEETPGVEGCRTVAASVMWLRPAFSAICDGGSWIATSISRSESRMITFSGVSENVTFSGVVLSASTRTVKYSSPSTSSSPRYSTGTRRVACQRCTSCPPIRLVTKAKSSARNPSR